jgi:hypothetical protein
MGLVDLHDAEAFSPYLATPHADARMFIYRANTDQLAPLFEDDGLTTMVSNPVRANAQGAFPIRYAIDGEYGAAIQDRRGQHLLAVQRFTVRPTQASALSHEFRTFAQLLADSQRKYTDTRETLTVYPGDLFRVVAGGSLYRVAAPGAEDHHLTTSGGLKLYVQPDADGYHPVEAFGFTGDGSPEDRERLQRASDATPFLKFQARTYELGAHVETPASYGAHRRCCILATNDIAWRSIGRTTLRIADTVQSGPHANDVTILFVEDREDFSAPGFVFDQNTDAQGYGSPFACYGVARVDLDRIEVRNGGAVRIGASAARLSGEVRGNITIGAGTGTFALGGKPGGTTRWRNVSAYVENCRGGVNIECEDVNAFGLMHETIEADFGQIVGYNLDGGSSPVEFVKVEDGAKRVNIDLISLNTAASSGTGRAAALCIKQGQDGNGMDRVSVGRISCKNVEQAIYLEMAEAPQGALYVGALQADRVRCLFDSRNSVGAAVGEAASAVIQNVQGTVLSPGASGGGTAFCVESDPTSPDDNAYPPHLRALQIRGGHLSSVQERTFSIRGVRRFECHGLAVESHLSATPSGGYAGGTYNVIEADEILLTDTMLRGFAGTGVPLELRPKVSCRLRGCDLQGNGSGTALFLNGSGNLLLEGCQMSGATNALNFRVLQAEFDPLVAVDSAGSRIVIPNHPFRHGELVRFTAGGGGIGGLADGAEYRVIYLDANSIQLSDSLRGSAIALSSATAGAASLRKALTVKLRDLRNSCPTLVANSDRPLSFTQDGSW